MIVFDSPSSTRILGYPEGYFIGKNPLDYIHPEDREKVQNDLKDVFEDNNSGIPTEFRIRKADGTYLPVESVAQNLMDVPGIEGVVATTHSIGERKKMEEDLINSIEEKNVLLKEIHHRVKNNMQIISSLLSLQKNYVDDVEAVNVLKESQNRVKSMSMIHENLYQSKKFTKVNLSIYIRKLVLDLFYSYAIEESRAIHIIEVEDVMLNIETAVPCGLIISELVSNSLKYAFPTVYGRGPSNEKFADPTVYDRGSVNEKFTDPVDMPTDRYSDGRGELKIILKQIDDSFELIVMDNGVGIPEDIDFKNTNSLGLQLVNNLVAQVDGEIELDRTGGTKFKIIFKELNFDFDITVDYMKNICNKVFKNPKLQILK
jgi:PAS domain S-box-containing protein